MDPYQFYPTPASLAERVWALLKKGNWARVLEPQAGNGDLALACPDWKREYGDRVPIDCCEINLEHHPTLRAKGLNVVGTDFLQFRNGHCYDVIIQNPPFSQGAKHVLHAWDIAWDCELVSIINASTINSTLSDSPVAARERCLHRSRHPALPAQMRIFCGGAVAMPALDHVGQFGGRHWSFG